MRRLALLPALCLVLALAAPARGMDAHKVFFKAVPSVVTILVKGSYKDKKGLGSGFVVGGGDLVVTNFHVVAEAYRLELKTWNGTMVKEVQIVGKDKEHDLALLHIREALPALDLAADEVQVGQEVVAIGSPLGLDHTVSTGVVSGKRKTDKGWKLVQITAPVSPGSSGGPVLNTRGQVVGVTVMAVPFVAQNVNFAVYVGHVRDLLDQHSGAASSPVARSGRDLEINKAPDGSITIIQKRRPAQ